MSDEMTDQPSAALLVPEVEPVPDTHVKPKWWSTPLAAGVAGLAIGAGSVGGAWVASSNSGPSATPATPATPAATASPSAAKFALSGTMTLNQLSLQSGLCTGTGGYNDIAEGASVTVYDSGSQVIATGHLGAGVRSGLKCSFPVWVAGVPIGSQFFQVEVSHRGKITLSAEDAQAGRFAASLG